MAGDRNVTAGAGASDLRPSALTAFLQNMNQKELSSTSATLNGIATVLDDESEAAKYFKRKHLALNPLGPDSKAYIDNANVSVILVRISSARVADLEHSDTVGRWDGNSESD